MDVCILEGSSMKFSSFGLAKTKIGEAYVSSGQKRLATLIK